MNKYEEVIKVLSQVDRETLERLVTGFLNIYDYGYFLKYEDSREVLRNFIKYFPHTDVRLVKATVNDSTFSVFGDIIETSHLKEEQYCLVRWNKNADNFDKKSLSVLNIAKCDYCFHEECNDCCYENIFFIEEFYNCCLNQEFIKNLIKELKNSDEKVKENNKNKEKKENNMDNLRTIAEKLVDDFSEYEEIIDKLRDVGVSDEKIYNIFYEILKDIIE
mgnify:CR=1 FL=1|jgi:hypothetical protein